MHLPESVNTIATPPANAAQLQNAPVVRNGIPRAFATSGTSPTVDDIITILRGLSRQEATRICRKLAEKDLIVWGEAGECVQSAYPFSGFPTTHTLHLKDGPKVYALCAVDALGMPVMLGRAADISSRCTYCQAPVEVAVAPEGLRQYRPTESVVWFPLALDVCCPVAESRCPDINFFCSAEHRDTWWQARGQPEGLSMTMPEAFEAGREIYGSLLTRSASNPG